MRTLATFGYLLVLVAAFAVGLVGTLAASRGVASMAHEPPTHVGKPVRLPGKAVPQRGLNPTVEC